MYLTPIPETNIKIISQRDSITKYINELLLIKRIDISSSMTNS